MNSLVLVRSLVLSVCFVQSLQTNTRSDSGNGEIQIHFTGNKVFSDDQLLGAMHWAVQPNLNRSTNLGIDRDEVKKGADRIREFMVDQGYLLSEVGDPRLERSKTGLIVTIPVKEGRLFRLGRVRFENSTLFSQEQLLEIFGVKGGEIAASFGAKSREGFERLKRIYSNYGYLNWTIITKTDMKDHEGIVDYTLRLEEDPVFSVRRISFFRSTKNEQALRTQFLIGEDKYLAGASWTRVFLRVHRLGLTEELGPGDVKLQPDESTHEVDVKINLREKTRLPNP